jgi:hypothetical protein
MALGPQSNATVQMVIELDNRGDRTVGRKFLCILTNEKDDRGSGVCARDFRNDPAKAFLSLLMISKPISAGWWEKKWW